MCEQDKSRILQENKDSMTPYDCLIIGGGMAGLQAAIQLGRYSRDVLVIDGGDGRSVLCQSYHNLLGWPEGVSGPTLRDLGKQQASALGVKFLMDFVNHVSYAQSITTQEASATGRDLAAAARPEDGSLFKVETVAGRRFLARRLLLATGLVDSLPNWPALGPCLGVTVYVCPDCDGYEVKNRKTVVIGRGKSGPEMAVMLLYFTQHITYVHDDSVKIEDALRQQLIAQGVLIEESQVSELLISAEACFAGVRLQSGRVILGDRAFLGYGGSEVRSQLASDLSIPILENGHIQVDARTKETTVPRVYAAGDVTVHSEQVSIAIGDGAQAAIWIHKSLLHIH